MDEYLIHIPRGKALQIARQIIEDAERERASVAETESDQSDDINSLVFEPKRQYVVYAYREPDLYEQIAQLRAKVAELHKQLQLAQENNHRRNVELDALHHVWCSGGCDEGVHRWAEGEITQEIVDAAVRNTERLVKWFENRKLRGKNDAG